MRWKIHLADCKISVWWRFRNLEKLMGKVLTSANQICYAERVSLYQSTPVEENNVRESKDQTS